jgi:hypothetical protein
VWICPIAASRGGVKGRPQTLGFGNALPFEDDDEDDDEDEKDSGFHTRGEVCAGRGKGAGPKYRSHKSYSHPTER